MTETAPLHMGIEGTNFTGAAPEVSEPEGAVPSWDSINRELRRVTEAEVRGLADRIAHDAEAQLRKWGSEPSADHLWGIREPSEFIAKMAYGVAPSIMAISSMSTGMGKSEIVAAAGRVITADAALSDIGMVVFINTIRDLEAMKERMGFADDDPRFAIFTGKRNVELNAMGGALNEAQVLLTTQSKFLWWSQHLSYRAKDFYYRGKPRQLRLWDETALPIDTMTLTPEHLHAFANELFERKLHEVAMQVQEWADELARLPHDSVVKVPCFEKITLPCNSTGRMPRHPEADDDDDETVFNETCAALAWLKGREVRVYREKYTGSVALSYREILPATLTPLLVLDANADKRVAYKMMTESRGCLLHLHSPQKTYRNATLYRRAMAAGRRQHHKRATRRPLIEAAADAFFMEQAKGPREVLLLSFKPDYRKKIPDMLRAVRREIKKRGGRPSLLRGLTWGMEKGTNTFRNTHSVIALGVLQAPLYQIIADVRGIQRLPPKADVDQSRVEAHRRTEQMATFFQGISRSAIRKTTRDGDVPEGSTIYLIASDNGPMRFPDDLVPEWMPHLNIVEWEPDPLKLRSGKFKTDRRIHFFEVLKARADGEPFGYRSFEPVFTRKMVITYLTDGSLVKALRAEGLELERLPPRKGRGGSAHWFRVRQANPLLERDTLRVVQLRPDALAA